MALTDPLLGVVRPSLSLALRVSELALEGAAGMVRIARHALESTTDQAASDGSDVFGAYEDETPPWERAEGAVAGEPPPPPPPEPEPMPDPDPIPKRPPVPETVKTEDDEPEFVATFADEGAEEGAGAELRVDEPWEGYDGMKATEVVRALADAAPEAVAAVRLYEAAGKKRRSVIEAAERRLDRA